MKNRYYSLLTAMPFILLLLFAGTAESQNQTIGGDLTGAPLQEYLRANYSPNSTLGYNRARDRMYTILDNHEGMVVCVYTYFEMPVDPNSSSPRADAFDNGNGINAEHLWPQSLGAGSEPARSDLHSLYSSEVRVNADRGNLSFGTIPDSETDRWYNKVNRDESSLIFTTTPPPADERDDWSKWKNNDRFEAKLDTKGDIARAMFYFYTIYRDEADAQNSSYFSSMDEDLLSWHDLDEVDDYEVWRTETISGWQGNVNPFVMDTTLVRRAYFMEDGGYEDDPDPDTELVEIFSETFGAVSSTTAINEHTFDNESFTFEGNGDIRESIPSQGYEGASGNAQLFMNLGNRYFTIGKINTIGFGQIDLTFGIYSTGTTPFTIEYSVAESEGWTELTYSASQQAGVWTLIEIVETELPAVESLSIRFSKDNGFQYRLDDIVLLGEETKATSNERNTDRPSDFVLDQNYPNPFNPSTSIEYELQQRERVKLSVFDMAGREVAVLVNAVKPAGRHQISWDASGASSGIYVYSLETKSHRATRKMTLIK